MAHERPLRTEPTEKRIRAYLDGELVADTTGALLVWEDRPYPGYHLPEEDVRLELVPDGASRRVVPGHVHLAWGAMDAWFEEDEEVYVHPRDPHTRVDVLTSSRHVEVIVDGVTVADSHRPTLLFETGLPTRFYLPKTDLRLDLMTPTDRTTRCPYKGMAEYYSVTVDGHEHRDVAWWYRHPLAEVGGIRGLVAFYDERVDLRVDGRLRTRPSTVFS
jgi:uncharacterized protein (DUF427 family)